jgi:hypothetical protein
LHKRPSSNIAMACAWVGDSDECACSVIGKRKFTDTIKNDDGIT